MMHSSAAAGHGSSMLLPAILAAAAVFAATLGNPLLVLASALTLLVIWWGALSSPPRVVLAAYLSYQWLQVSTKLALANLFGVDLGRPQVALICAECGLEVNERTPDAILIGLASLVAMALGILAFGPRGGEFRPDTRALSPTRLLVAYLALVVWERLAGRLAVGGLAQPILILGTMKFVPVVLLIYMWIIERRGTIPLVLCVFLEVGLGFTGFFGGFQGVFIVGIVSLLTIVRSERRRVSSVLVVALPCLLLLGSFWTVIKPAYRAILNQGTSSQVVVIGMEEQAKALRDLGSNIGSSELLDGLVKLALRLSYVDYLSYVLQYVPRSREHQGGGLWAESILYVLTPRLLFPNKPPLASDSERTNLYTGLSVASGDQGTSISIGYVGEGYIDFGILGTIAVSFLLGSLYAFTARHILALGRGRDIAVAVAVLIVVLSPVRSFEASNMKLFPALIWDWLVGVLVVTYLWRSVRPYLARNPIGGHRPSTLPRGST